MDTSWSDTVERAVLGAVAGAVAGALARLAINALRQARARRRRRRGAALSAPRHHQGTEEGGQRGSGLDPQRVTISAGTGSSAGTSS